MYILLVPALYMHVHDYMCTHTCTCICNYKVHTIKVDDTLFSCSKGETENAVKFLEMYVEVAEKAGLQTSLAKAYSATGIMYNTLVSRYALQ